MTTSFPQELEDEIRALLIEAETRLEREVEKLRERRNRLIAEGWLFETSFRASFATAGGALFAMGALSRTGHDVKVSDTDPPCLIVRVYLPLDEDQIAAAQEGIDALVALHGGGVDTSDVDLDRRRQPNA